MNLIFLTPYQCTNLSILETHTSLNPPRLMHTNINKTTVNVNRCLLVYQEFSTVGLCIKRTNWVKDFNRIKENSCIKRPLKARHARPPIVANVSLLYINAYKVHVSWKTLNNAIMNRFTRILVRVLLENSYPGKIYDFLVSCTHKHIF